MLRKLKRKSDPRPEDHTVVKLEERSPSIYLQQAAELYEPVEQQQPSGLMGGLKAIVGRIHVVKEKRPEQDPVLEKMEQIFTQLHDDFDHRERLLDKKLEAIEKMQERETRMLKWFSVPLAVFAMVGLGFLFYIAYSMQHSVADMSTNMSAMSGDISSMTSNTQAMSTNMSQMTGSMQHLNNNVSYMTNDVSNMSNNMGSMSRSMQPIGQAAGAATPMIGMMRSIMPF